MKTLLIGIAGEDGSGKTTMKNTLRKAMPERQVAVREMSTPLYEIAEYFGVDVEEKTPELRRRLIAINAFGGLVAPHAAGPWVLEHLLRDVLGDAAEAEGLDVPAPDLFVIAGVRREEEVRWIHAHGGLCLYLRPRDGSMELPHWFTRGLDFPIPSPLIAGGEADHRGGVRGALAMIDETLRVKAEAQKEEATK